MKGFTLAALVAVLLPVLGGCVKAIAPPLTTVAPAERLVVEKNYVVGKQQTATVGQPMVRVVEKDVRPKYLTMTPRADFRLDGTYSKKIVFEHGVAIAGSKTDRYPLVGTMRVDGVDYYLVDMRDTRGTTYAVLVGLDNRLTEKYLVDDDHDYLMQTLGATVVPGDVAFTVNSEANDAATVVRAGTTNFELVYSGINKVALEMKYKEYTPDYRDNPSPLDVMRSAIRKVVSSHPDTLEQSLVYPLGTGTVAVRNLKIRIDEATPEKIVYTVLDDGQRN